MTVRKFCKCGVKLEREVVDEDAAREVTAKFRAAHSGYGHGPANREQYLQTVSRIVARRAKANSPRQVKPLLSAIARAESSMDGDDIRPHRWITGRGIVFCSVCLLLKQASGIHLAQRNMKLRTYRAGRETGRWRKGERVTSLAEIKPGELLIKDSHQFQSTNLVKVESIRDMPIGFRFNYVTPAGNVIKEPMMMTHEFELPMDHDVFYRAVK